MIAAVKTDVAVVGAGPAGLAAGAKAALMGAEVLILERNPAAGGVLNQCIHDGFGLYRYGASLSGPEFARLALGEAERSGAKVLLGATVTDISPERVLTVTSPKGLYRVEAKSVVLASGCRERTRSAIMIPGSRPAGIFTAGTAQELLNLRGLKVGSRAVVLGSGDVGLIVARRLSLTGVKVEAICEAGETPTGLTRNVVQCAREFNIPIYTKTTVSRINGKSRVTSVELSGTDENMRPVPGTERLVPCDTLILSVGLIPERDLVSKLGTPNPDGSLSGAEGIFLCGNCKKIEQLADMASLSGEAAGEKAALFARGLPISEFTGPKMPKLQTGLPEENTVICTRCPRGCCVTVCPDGSVCGNSCKEGERFAREEISSPRRYLTVSVPSDRGYTVSLRTEKPISASLLKAEAQRLSKLTLKGESILPNGKCGLSAGGEELIVTGVSPLGFLASKERE